MANNPPDISYSPPAPAVWRRLASVCYDLLLLSALLVFATAIIVLPLGLLLGLSISGSHPLFRIYLFAISIWFFCWFWVHGGQTLGMRAWRIRLVANDGSPVSWRKALLRYFAAILSWLPLGLGFFWALFDTEKRSWHDRLSATQLILIPKSKP